MPSPHSDQTKAEDISAPPIIWWSFCATIAKNRLCSARYGMELCNWTGVKTLDDSNWRRNYQVHTHSKISNKPQRFWTRCLKSASSPFPNTARSIIKTATPLPGYQDRASRGLMGDFILGGGGELRGKQLFGCLKVWMQVFWCLNRHWFRSTL